MKRNAEKDLLEWKNSEDRKPLILKGARQVGKTWLMKDFGNSHYRNVAYFNFDSEANLSTIFDRNKDPHRIIELLSLLSGEAILPGETLLLFDEIQECPSALNTLKYFNEEANEYHIIAAGSLLGTFLAQPKSYPVGKVNLLQIAPMKFDEFLLATDEILYRYFDTLEKGVKIEEIFHQKLMEAYRRYLIIGGMPECVSAWLKYKDPTKVLKIQKDLISVYSDDINKHNNKINGGRILMALRCIPAQLAKSNEKYIYGVIKEGARAREFEEAIEWLASAGLVNRLYNISKPEHPLAVYERPDCFKLFLFDTGLLKAMAELDNSAIILNEDFQFKGPLSENYVLQQIKSLYDSEPRYYGTDRMELDFLIQKGSTIIPIECKGGEDRSANSFKKYIAEKHPETAIRFSSRSYIENENFINLPLYLACRMDRFL